MKSILFIIFIFISGYTFCQKNSNFNFITNENGNDIVLFIKEGKVVSKELVEGKFVDVFLDFGPYNMLNPTTIKSVKLYEKDYILVVNKEKNFDSLYIFQFSSGRITSRQRLIFKNNIEELEVTESNGTILGNYKNGSDLEVFWFEPESKKLIESNISIGEYIQSLFLEENKKLLYIYKSNKYINLSIVNISNNGHIIEASTKFDSIESIQLTKLNCNIENIYILNIGENHYLLKILDGNIKYLKISTDSIFPDYYKDRDYIYYGFYNSNKFIELNEFKEFESKTLVLSNYLLYTPYFSINYENTLLNVVFQDSTYYKELFDIDDIFLIGDMVLTTSKFKEKHNIKLYKIGYEQLEFYSEININREINRSNLKIFSDGLILDNQLGIFFDNYNLIEILDEYKNPWIASNYLFYTNGTELLVGCINE